MFMDGNFIFFTSDIPSDTLHLCLSVHELQGQWFNSWSWIHVLDTEPLIVCERCKL